MKHAKRKLAIVLLFMAGITAGLCIAICRRPSGNVGALATPEEQEFVDTWRRIARNPFPPEGAMRENVFAIEVQCENPVLRELTIKNTGDTILNNFWLHREGSPNFYNVATIVRSCTDENQSDSEKVIALFDLFRTHYENFWPINPAGMLDDPPTLLASVGYGQCNLAACAFELLCQSVGVETRRIGVELVENGKTRFAHNAVEAYLDGAWRYFDPDGRVFYRLADGTIACVEQLKADASPIRNGPAPVGYRRELYAAAFERGNVIVYEPREPLRRKTMYENMSAFPLMYREAMRYDLPPGMKLVLSRDPAEKFFVRGLGGVSDTSAVNGEVPPCASGRIEWHISPASFGDVANVLSSGDELVVAIKSPYVIAGGQVAAETTGNAREIGFLPFVFSPTYKHTFHRLTPRDGSASVKLGPALPKFHPLTGFALKVDRNGLGKLQVTADIQHNPRALPKLTRGENRFVLWSPWPCAFTVENSPTASVVETDNGLRLRFEFSQKKAGLDAAPRLR